MVNHKKNRKVERDSLQYLLEAMPGFYVPDLSEKRRLLSILGVSRRFSQAFDGIRMHVENYAAIQTAADFDLIETKTTGEYLPNFPKGFFFGMTENEEMLLKVLEGKYLLCFVSLSPALRVHQLVSWAQLKLLIRTKRIQYQINLVR